MRSRGPSTIPEANEIPRPTTSTLDSEQVSGLAPFFSLAFPAYDEASGCSARERVLRSPTVTGSCRRSTGFPIEAMLASMTLRRMRSGPSERADHATPPPVCQAARVALSRAPWVERVVLGMRLAVSDRMENSASDVQQASFAELLRQVVQDGQTFLRAETELLKVEARTTLKTAALYLVLVMGSGLLLAIALSLIAAAIVIAAHGCAAAALLTAAAVDVVVSASAITFMIMKVRQSSQKAAAATTQITSSPQRGSHVS
jgi:hypothetical protein